MHREQSFVLYNGILTLYSLPAIDNQTEKIIKYKSKILTISTIYKIWVYVVFP